MSNITKQIILLLCIGVFCNFLIGCDVDIKEGEIDLAGDIEKESIKSNTLKDRSTDVENRLNANDDDQELTVSQKEEQVNLEGVDDGILWEVFGTVGKYNGQMSNNVPNGYGVWEHGDDVYDGYWVGGEMHGQGTFIYGDRLGSTENNYYHGEWNKGKWHGRGKYVSADGYMIEGLWENDKLVSIRTKSEEQISSEIKNIINSFKETSGYFLDPLLCNMGLSRWEIINNNGTPSEIIPHYYGFASYGGGSFDYYCYDEFDACFMFPLYGLADSASVVGNALLNPGAKFLGIELGKTTFEEISTILGEPKDKVEVHYYMEFYTLKGSNNDGYPINIVFIGNTHDDYPSWAEVNIKELINLLY